MLRVEVEANVNVRSGRTREGKPFEIREQHGYITMGREVRKVSLRLEAGAEPRPAGFYQVADESFTTDEYGNLVVARLVLVPAGK